MGGGGSSSIGQQQQQQQHLHESVSRPWILCSIYDLGIILTMKIIFPKCLFSFLKIFTRHEVYKISIKVFFLMSDGIIRTRGFMALCLTHEQHNDRSLVSFKLFAFATLSPSIKSMLSNMQVIFFVNFFTGRNSKLRSYYIMNANRRWMPRSMTVKRRNARIRVNNGMSRDNRMVEYYVNCE